MTKNSEETLFFSSIKQFKINTPINNRFGTLYRFLILAMIGFFSVSSTVFGSNLVSKNEGVAATQIGFETRGAYNREDFCDFAKNLLMQTSVGLSENQSLAAINNFLRDLKAEKVVDEIRLSENLVLPTVSLFQPWGIRKGRTFLLSAWDLNRLLEMQTRIDVLVIGSIDYRKIELVKNALTSTGIRIFPITLESLPNGMEALASASDGIAIKLPGHCK